MIRLSGNHVDSQRTLFPSFRSASKQVQTSSEVQVARDPTIVEHHFLARRSVIKRSNEFQVSTDPVRNPYWKQQDLVICRIG